VGRGRGGLGVAQLLVHGKGAGCSTCLRMHMLECRLPPRLPPIAVLLPCPLSVLRPF